jgi:outer membrane protein assembly factor BamB
MNGYDPRGSRDNSLGYTLSPSSVGEVGVTWSFPTPAPVAGTPPVFRDEVFDGDKTGNFYAIDRNTGSLLWRANVGVALTDSPVATPQGVVVFGDNTGNVWGLNGRTAATLWKTHPSNDAGPYTSIWGSPIQVGSDVVIGTASNEEGAIGIKTYLANGSVVLLNPQNGNILWQTYVIQLAAYATGWRGASVWCTPTYDNRTNTIYVTTGNYFAHGTSADPGVEDATIAVDASTGSMKWADELVEGDI